MRSTIFDEDTIKLILSYATCRDAFYLIKANIGPLVERFDRDLYESILVYLDIPVSVLYGMKAKNIYKYYKDSISVETFHLVKHVFEHCLRQDDNEDNDTRENLLKYYKKLILNQPDNFTEPANPDPDLVSDDEEFLYILSFMKFNHKVPLKYIADWSMYFAIEIDVEKALMRNRLQGTPEQFIKNFLAFPESFIGLFRHLNYSVSRITEVLPDLSENDIKKLYINSFRVDDTRFVNGIASDFIVQNLVNPVQGTRLVKYGIITEDSLKSRPDILTSPYYSIAHKIFKPDILDKYDKNDSYPAGFIPEEYRHLFLSTALSDLDSCTDPDYIKKMILVPDTLLKYSKKFGRIRDHERIIQKSKRHWIEYTVVHKMSPPDVVYVSKRWNEYYGSILDRE